MTARLVTDSPSDDSSASITDWVLIARTSDVFEDKRLVEVAEPIAPQPRFSLWTDQFNNLIDVLKSNPIDELRKLIGFG